MPTAKDLTAEELEVFRAAARRRRAAEKAALAQREQRAWELARLAAALLRERFGAGRVVVFGSLVHPGCFTERSDVDLAAWGLQPHDTLRAMGAVMDLGQEIPLNLVDVNICRPVILEAIERDGVAV